MRNYQTLMLSEEPKILGIPVTSGVPLIGLTVLGLVLGYAFELFILGALVSFYMHHKFGGLPIRQFWAIVYWSLPRELTRLVFRRAPDSSHRFYIR